MDRKALATETRLVALRGVAPAAPQEWLAGLAALAAPRSAAGIEEASKLRAGRAGTSKNRAGRAGTALFSRRSVGAPEDLDIDIVAAEPAAPAELAEPGAPAATSEDAGEAGDGVR